METSYDVRIYKVTTYQGSRTTSYRVRWSVGGRRQGESFRTVTLADSFRSELVRAARLGEAFVIETGRPVSMDRAERKVSWLVFAREYAAMKWPKLAPNSRRNTARALTNATLAMTTDERGRPDDADLRKALTAWAFNLRNAGNGTPPAHIARALAWLERNTRDVGDLSTSTVARAMLDALTVTADGSPAAPATVQRQRGVVVNIAEYAVERQLLLLNPITELSWKAPRTVQSVDRRVVVNPDQARALLDAAAMIKPSGARLVAFFGAAAG